MESLQNLVANLSVGESVFSTRMTLRLLREFPDEDLAFLTHTMLRLLQEDSNVDVWPIFPYALDSPNTTAPAE